MHVKGFANGGRVGDPPFDLLSPHGKRYIGKDVLPGSKFERLILMMEAATTAEAPPSPLAEHKVKHTQPQQVRR